MGWGGIGGWGWNLSVQGWCQVRTNLMRSTEQGEVLAVWPGCFPVTLEHCICTKGVKFRCVLKYNDETVLTDFRGIKNNRQDK